MANIRDIDKFVEWDPVQRLYRPVFWRRNIMPFWLGFSESDVPFGQAFTVPAAPAISGGVHFKQPYSSVEGLDQNLGNPLVVKGLVFEDSTDTTALANYTVTLEEVGQVRQLMNRECHVRTIFGVAQQPALLREIFLLGSQATLTMKTRKIGGGAVNVRHYLVGDQYVPWDPQFQIKPREKAQIVARIKAWYNRRSFAQPYWLTTDLPCEVGANATADFTAKIGDDGHFEAFGLTAVATGNFGLSISEVKTRQTLMNGQITQTNGIGTARFPAIFANSYLVPAGYRVNFRVTDLSGAPNTIFLTVFGRRIYAPFLQARQIARHAVPIGTMVDNQAPLIPAPI